jgi:hypothetical protein
MDEPVEYLPTEKAQLFAARLRIDELEKMLRYFDRAVMDLHHYVRAVDGQPNVAEWTLVREQIAEMVDSYGPRNPHR